MIATQPHKPSAETAQAKVPNYLVYETFDGEPVHYKGYKEVLDGNKTFSEIMGSSGIQSFIVAYFQRMLFIKLDENLYTIFSSESGLHLDKGNNLAGDILIFDNTSLPLEAITAYYVDVPPKIVIEVDIMADPSDMDSTAYLFKKTQKLLDFGVEKVIWVTTNAKKVTVATSGSNWQVMDWGNEVEILEGITFNVGKYLADKGLPFA